MDPDFIAKTAQIASVLEVSGYPKPGNVHRTQDFTDMVFEDFLISGVVIGKYHEKGCKTGSNPWFKFQRNVQDRSGETH